MLIYSAGNILYCSSTTHPFLSVIGLYGDLIYIIKEQTDTHYEVNTNFWCKWKKAIPINYLGYCAQGIPKYKCLIVSELMFVFVKW